MVSLVSGPLVRYVLVAAIRDRLVLTLLLLMAVGASLAIFLGSSAVTEASRFALVFAAGGLRFAGALGLVLFIVFYLRRAFDSRDVDYLLSRPIGRVSFVLSHAAAFTTLATAAALLVSLTVCLLSPHTVGPGFAMWAFSLCMEYVIMANAALFFAMVLPGAASGALAVLALYVLARMMGQILGIVHTGVAGAEHEVLGTVMQVVALIVPRLDLFAQTGWLVYGPDAFPGYGLLLLQGLLWSGLAVAATSVDLVRRQF